MKSLLLVACALLAPLPVLAQSRTPPQPNCLDARQIGAAEGISADTVAIRLRDGQRFQVTLSGDCPTPNKRMSVQGAAGGWLCGSSGEALVLQGQQCPVETVTPIDAAGYADLLRQRDGTPLPTNLAPVQVQSTSQSRGFRGSADYCVGVNHVRRWSENPQGITVEVSPNRAAGNRFYRIELGSGCPQLSNAQQMQLISGLGIGMVCGHPGDRIQLSRPEREMIRPGDRANFSGKYDCQISRVYPVADQH